MMNVHVLNDYQQMSKDTADFIVSYINQKPNSLVCLAAGSTPIGTLSYLVKYAKAGKVDFSNCTFVGLDEWVGMDKKDQGSCQSTLYTNFFSPLGIKNNRIFFFDAKASDLLAETQRIDDFIFEHGSIDLMLLGLGVNGHLGFNEPGVSFDLYSHVIELDKVTISVGQKYFQEQKNLHKGITLGLAHVMNTKTVLLVANGATKAEAVYRLLQGDICQEVPASILQKHPQCHMFFDTEAYRLRLLFLNR